MLLTDIDRAVSWLTRLVLVSAWVCSMFYIFGSYIEQSYFKVRLDQRIENVEYDKNKGYLCWDWYSIKARLKPATNMGVVLTDAENRKMLLTTFNRYTFTPWQLSKPIGLGRVNQPLCTFIPPGYKPKPPFTVNQYVVYPGLLNMWSLTTHLPPIEVKPDHDTSPTINDDKVDNAH